MTGLVGGLRGGQEVSRGGQGVTATVTVTEFVLHTMLARMVSFANAIYVFAVTFMLPLHHRPASN